MRKRGMCLLLSLLLVLPPMLGVADISAMWRETAETFLKTAGVSAEPTEDSNDLPEYVLPSGGVAWCRSCSDAPQSGIKLLWELSGASDEELALFLNAQIDEWAAAMRDPSLTEDERESGIRVGLYLLADYGKQAVAPLLARLRTGQGDALTDELCARLCSRILGTRDGTAVPPSEGQAWLRALNIVAQDVLPPVDAAIYTTDEPTRAATQALIDRERATSRGGVFRDVDYALNCDLVWLYVAGSEQQGDTLTLWAAVFRSSFALFGGQRAYLCSGSIIPSRLTMRRDGAGEWHLYQVDEAEDGESYAPSIYQMCRGHAGLAEKLMSYGRQDRTAECLRSYLTTNGWDCAQVQIALLP